MVLPLQKWTVVEIRSLFLVLFAEGLSRTEIQWEAVAVSCSNRRRWCRDFETGHECRRFSSVGKAIKITNRTVSIWPQVHLRIVLLSVESGRILRSCKRRRHDYAHGTQLLQDGINIPVFGEISVSMCMAIMWKNDFSVHYNHGYVICWFDVKAVWNKFGKVSALVWLQYSVSTFQHFKPGNHMELRSLNFPRRTPRFSAGSQYSAEHSLETTATSYTISPLSCLSETILSQFTSIPIMTLNKAVKWKHWGLGFESRSYNWLLWWLSRGVTFSRQLQEQ